MIYSPQALAEGRRYLDYLYFELQIPAHKAIFLFREYVRRRTAEEQERIIEEIFKEVSK